MSLQTWQETLISSTAAGSNFASFTTAKTVLPTGCLVTLPANWWYVGRMLRINVYGSLSNVTTTPGTVTMQVMQTNVVAFTTGAMQFSTTAHTNLPFWFHCNLTCRAVGSGTSANLMGQAAVFSQTLSISGADTTTSHSFLMAPATAPAVGTGFDSTASQTLDFWTGFSSSQAGNNITVHQYVVEALN